VQVSASPVGSREGTVKMALMSELIVSRAINSHSRGKREMSDGREGRQETELERRVDNSSSGLREANPKF